MLLWYVSLEIQTLQGRALVVVVDGQLTKELRDILDASKLLIEVYENSKWMGTGYVLAKGLSVCRSEIIIRVDADDLSVPNRCLWQVMFLYNNPSISVLGGQMQEIIKSKNGTSIKRLRNVPCDYQQIKNLSCWRNPINHPTVALRRSHIIGVGNYQTCLYFEDWYLWLRLISNNYKLRNDPRILVSTYITDSHLNRRHGSNYLLHEIKFFYKLFSNSLMPIYFLIINVIIRAPLRLIPKLFLKQVIFKLLRKHGNHF